MTTTEQNQSYKESSVCDAHISSVECGGATILSLSERDETLAARQVIAAVTHACAACDWNYLIGCPGIVCDSLTTNAHPAEALRFDTGSGCLRIHAICLIAISCHLIRGQLQYFLERSVVSHDLPIITI